MSNRNILASLWDKKNTKQKVMIIAISIAIILLIITAVVFVIPKIKDKITNTDSGKITEQDDNDIIDKDAGAKEDTTQGNSTNQEDITITDEDPQEFITHNNTENDGANVDISETIDENKSKITEVSFGIDVSKYQGTIDWKSVAEAGIDFVMVRVGYRTMVNGEIAADTNAKYNMQEAQKYGIKVGAYFFSTAISGEEAIEEANWVADYIAKYKITYPVAYNCEGFENTGSRQYNMTKTQRTDAALAFMNRITERGYTAMFYASKEEIESNAKWETTRISASHKGG